MTKIQIPHDAIVFVGDGCKALFLRNAGDEKYPNLKTERVFVDHNPSTREQGTDKPGRSYASVGPGRSRSRRPIGMTWRSTVLRAPWRTRSRDWCASAR